MKEYLAIIGTVVAIEFLVFFIIIGYDLLKPVGNKKLTVSTQKPIMIELPIMPDYSKLMGTLIDKTKIQKYTCIKCKYFRLSRQMLIAPVANIFADGYCKNQNQKKQPIIIDCKSDSCEFLELK